MAARTAIAALLLVLASGCATAIHETQCRTDASVQAEIDLITEMEQERIAAGVRKDADAVAAVTEEDYAQIDFDGRLLDRDAALARIRGSGIRLTSNTIDELVVRTCGDTSVVTGGAHPRGVLNGEEFSPDIRYSRVYLRRGGQWRVILFQQTRVAGGR